MPKRPNGTQPPEQTPAPTLVPPAPEKHPGGRPLKLIEDPEIEQRLLSYIRAGGYDWVSAEAAGISYRTFRRWMQQGSEDDAAALDTVFCQFWHKVRHAHAEARLAREVAVAQDEPLNWLMKGPGRERPGEPGWTNGDGDTAATVTAIQIEVVYAKRDDDQPVDRPQVTATVHQQLSRRA
jgi:hypothetical protein